MFFQEKRNGIIKMSQYRATGLEMSEVFFIILTISFWRDKYAECINE